MASILARVFWVGQGIAMLLAVLAALGCEKQAQQQGGQRPPTKVQAFAVQPQAFARSVLAIGDLRSPEHTEVATEIAGRVVFLDVPEGQRVEQGHVLARLDASTTRAELQIARARADGAQTTLERNRALAEEQLATQQELEEAQVQKRTASGEVSKTRAVLNKTVLVAPFAGTVGLRLVSLGTYLAPGTAVTRITNTEHLELLFPVPEKHAAEVEVGQSVRGRVGDCGQRFTGEVTAIDPFVDPSTRSLQVQARVENPEGRLKPGMSARVRLELKQLDAAIVIPEEALVRRGTELTVYVVREGKAQRTPVQAGDYRTGVVHITQGLAPGDQVITRGHQKLRPGAAVEVQPHQTVQNPTLSLGRAEGDESCAL